MKHLQVSFPILNVYLRQPQSRLQLLYLRPASTRNTILVIVTPSLYHPAPTSFLILAELCFNSEVCHLKTHSTGNPRLDLKFLQILASQSR